MAPGLLLIEDDVGVRQVLTRFLEQRGFVVWAAADGEEALSTAGREAIHLILSDIHLPDTIGTELLPRLLQWCPGVPFCFMSGDLSPDLRDDLTALGASQVFSKPFILTEVVETLWNLAQS
jgi:CheY-like chemotaxis protein